MALKDASRFSKLWLWPVLYAYYLSYGVCQHYDRSYEAQHFSSIESLKISPRLTSKILMKGGFTISLTARPTVSSTGT